MKTLTITLEVHVQDGKVHQVVPRRNDGEIIKPEPMHPGPDAVPDPRANQIYVGSLTYYQQNPDCVCYWYLGQCYPVCQ